jgi:L-alanine-DL-glutamate epimerase-like enolase superfamily enzyme
VVAFPAIMLHDLLLKEPLKLEDGYIKLPTNPGIGWELDGKKVDEYTVRDFPR